MGMAVGANHLSPRVLAFGARAQQQQIQEAYPERGVLSGGQQELIRSGVVRAIPPRDAASALQAQGFRLLDVRPAWEWEKGRVGNSLHVPLFVEDTGTGPITLLKKWVHFGYVGLWTGQCLTTINERFLPEVEEMVPDKEDKLLVSCGEGLR